jgi:hypothetical protein
MGSTVGRTTDGLVKADQRASGVVRRHSMRESTVRRDWGMRLRSQLLVAGASVLLFAAATAVGCGEADRPYRPKGQAARVGRDRTRPNVDARQYHTFTALRRPPRGLPTSVRVREPKLRLRPDLARPLPTINGIRLWLVPGELGLCIVAQTLRITGYGYVCAPADIAVKRGSIDISRIEPPAGPRGRPARTVIGVARVGASRAIIRTGRARRTVPIHGGIYVLSDQAERAPTRVIIKP